MKEDRDTTTVCTFHITEYMSPNIDGRGTDVLNIAKIVKSLFKSQEDYIIAGKWKTTEQTFENINNFKVYRCNGTYAIQVFFRIKFVGTFMLPIIPFVLILKTLKVIKNIKSKHRCNLILIFGHHLWGGIAAAVVAKLINSPSYLVLYGTSGAYGKFFDIIETLSFTLIKNSFKKIFILDDGSILPQKAISIFGLKKCSIFPQIIPEHALKYRRNAWKISKKGFVVLWLSGFNVAKNPEQAIYGFAYFLHSLNNPNNHHFKLVMLGDGPLLDDCKKLVKRLNIEKHVEFLGRVSVNEVMKNIESSNIVLVSSRSNSNFGRVALEALYLGTPLVATDTGRTREFLRSGKHSIICDNSPESIGDSILSIYLNPKLAKKIRFWGHKLVVSRHNPRFREKIFKEELLASVYDGEY